MHPFSKERAAAFVRLLPQQIKEKVEHEEQEWKSTVFSRLKSSIESDSYEEIEFWLLNLDVLQTSEIYFLTKDESQDILLTLFNFVVSSEHWRLVGTACRIFTDIFRPRHMSLDIKLPWRPVYRILQKVVFSRSKVKGRKLPHLMLQHLISFIRLCNYLFEDTATEEMLELWKPLLNPHYHTFVMAHGLLALFLPNNAGKHVLWFDDFMSIWPMYKSLHWDYQWVFLFARLSMDNYDDIDWKPHIPFIFNSLAGYIGIPHTVLESPHVPLHDYPADMYMVLFMDCTVTRLFPYYAYLLVNLLTNENAKETVRTHLEKLIFLMQPFCSPASQSDDSMSMNIAMVFLSVLTSAYAKRVKLEKKYGQYKLPLLTQDDHDWFVGLVVPLVLMERFTDYRVVTCVKELAQLSPDVLIPALLETVHRSFGIERLEITGIKTLSAIMPLIVSNPEYSQVVHDLLVKYTEDINFMLLQKSACIFAVFISYGRCTEIDESMNETILLLMRKCIEIAEYTPLPEYNHISIRMRSMLASVIRSASPSLRDAMLDLVADAVDDLSPKAIKELLEWFHRFGVKKFKERAIHAKEVKDFAILLGLMRHTPDFVRENIASIEESIDNGLNTDTDKVAAMAIVTIKSVLISLLSVYSLPLEESGHVSTDEVTVKWHWPSKEDIDIGDRLCEKWAETADKFIESDDIAKQTIGVKMMVAIMKGIVDAISNDMFDVQIEDPNMVQPKLARFTAPQLKRHWLWLYSRFKNLCKIETPEKLLNILLKEASIFAIPTNRSSRGVGTLASELALAKDSTTIALAEEETTYDIADVRSRHVFAYRHSNEHIPFTKQVGELISCVADLCVHHNMKIRKKVSGFLQAVSVCFSAFIGPYIAKIVSKIDENIDDRIALSGITLCLTRVCRHLTIATNNFPLLVDVALSACRAFPNDIPDESERRLRSAVNVTFEVVNLYDTRFSKDAFVEARKRLVVTAIERISQTKGDRSAIREVENYAIALIISVIQGSPKIVMYEVYNLLTDYLLSEDVSISDIVIHIMPFLLEILIPRVPRRKRFDVSTVTPENYDDVQFVDHFAPGISTTEPHFLSKEEYLSVDTQRVFFPTDAEERVEIYGMLYEKFIESRTLVDTLCEILISQQVHHEETYCKARVQFWASLVRVFGVEIALILLDVVENLTGENVTIANHIIAGEIFSSILFGVKGWSYANIAKLFYKLFPFLTRILGDNDCEFHPVWFISIVCGLSDRDPRRFFWLFDHLLSMLPKCPSQTRDVKLASLIIDVVLEFGWRMPDIVNDAVIRGIAPWFDSSLQSYEQVRECTVRAVSTLIGSSFRLETRDIPEHLVKLFNETLVEAGDQFLISWLLGEFTTQTMSSLMLNRLSIDKISDWIDLCLDKTEEDEKRARVCLLHLVRSNWLWACGNMPLTLETVHETKHRILDQLKPGNRVWQMQTVMLLLIESFVCANFFFFTDEEICSIINEVVLPALMNSNYDIQDSAAEVLSFLLESSAEAKSLIPDLVCEFRKLVFSGKTAPLPLKLSGVKGLGAIIHSTVLFDHVPDHVYDAFSALSEAQSTDSSLEPTISLTFTDFWTVHEGNLMPDVAEMLMPFRDSVRPSYFC